jgi:hypothetical protein
MFVTKHVCTSFKKAIAASKANYNKDVVESSSIIKIERV